MNHHNFFFRFFVATAIAGAISFIPLQEHDRYISTINNYGNFFTLNAEGGWSVKGYYLNKEITDTVNLEVILLHSNNINWLDEQLIGTINDSTYFPKNDLRTTYYLMPYNSWNIHITPKGYCFFNLLNGTVPPGEPVIIPIKIRFKVK